jgi:hypothetical protein
MMANQHTNLGPPAADKDPNLLSYYHATNQVRSLLNAHGSDAPCILVAPPGSGKTALLKWLKGGSHAFDVVSVEAEDFRPLPDDDKLAEPDAELIIRYELSKFVLERWLALNQGQHRADSIRQAYKRSEQSILGWIRNAFNERFSSIQAFGFGLSLNPTERKQYLQELRASEAAKRMEELLQKAATTTRPLIVAVDNPEQIVARALDATERDSALLTGVLLSVLEGLQTSGVRILALTRDNILASVSSYADYGHFSYSSTWLTWTSDDLVGVIAARVAKRLRRRWNTTFGLTKQEFAQEVIPWVVDGPRDLILLCNNALQIGSDGVADRSSFQHSVEALLEHKLTAVHGHYNTQYPRIREYIEAAAAEVAVNYGDKDIGKRELRACIVNKSRERSSKLFDLKTDQAWIDAMHPRTGQIESLLYDIGVIGVVDANGRRYAWTGRSPDRIQNAERVFLSPLFQLLGKE